MRLSKDKRKALLAAARTLAEIRKCTVKQAILWLLKQPAIQEALRGNPNERAN